MADAVFYAPLSPLPAPYAPPTFSAVPGLPPRLQIRRDFAGNGQIVGTTKTLSTPDNVPVRRHVYCMDALTGTIVADTWSDATTGAYTFSGLTPTRRYTVFAYDYTGLYGAVIADNLTPELMP